MSLHHFGPEKHISPATGQIVLRVWIFYEPQRILYKVMQFKKVSNILMTTFLIFYIFVDPLTLSFPPLIPYRYEAI